MTINRFFFKSLWNLINFKKLFKLTNQRHIFLESAHILHSLQGMNVKVTSVHKLILKNTNFLFSKIAVFLMYREIYIHVFVIFKQPTYHIGICIVLKNEAILTQIPCSNSTWFHSGFEWNQVAWFSQSHINWSKRKQYTMWYGSANCT